jgi:checkpoint serine/threonine-protein kinase
LLSPCSALSSAMPSTALTAAPAVMQWTGVSIMSEEEERAAMVAFGQAERQSGRQQERRLVLGGCTYSLGRRIGAGAYATVFQAGGGSALKLESPPCPWELYIGRALLGRVPPDARHLFLTPDSLVLGRQASVLELPRGCHGSLQDLLNWHLARSKVPDESIAIHFAAELLQAVGVMHAAGIIHTDLKPDNLLVAPVHGGDPSLDGVLGLQVIDFGRAVDLELLPPSVLLCGDSLTDAFRCVEMKEGTPWRWQADAYCAACTVHCILFGDYMKVERVVGPDGTARLRLATALRRYWACELWTRVFDALLNCVSEAPPPAAELATSLRAHLEGSKDLGKRLRVELGRLAEELRAT